MTVDYLSIGHHAARGVEVNWDLDLTIQDHEDLTQVGAIAAYRASQRRSGDRAYAYGAAKREIRNAVARDRNPHTTQISTHARPVRSSMRTGLANSVSGRLWQMLAADRARGGRRTEQIVDVEVAIVYLLASEHNNLSIANLLDLPLRTVQTYRNRIRQRLQHLLQQDT